MRKIFLLSFLFISLLCFSDTIIIDRNFLSENINAKAEYLFDSDNQYSILDIRSDSLVWYEMKDFKRLGFNSQTVWVKFSIRNLSDSQQIIFGADYPLLNYLECFQIKDERIKHFITGNGIKFSNRQFKHRLPVFKIQIDEGKTNIYLRIQTESSLDLNLKMWTSDEFYREENISTLGWWLYFGLLISMILYSSLLFFMTRANSYIYYFMTFFCYLMFQLSWSGFSYEFLWKDSIFLSIRSMPFFMNFGILSSTIFSIIYTDAKKLLPKWYKVNYILCILYLSWAILGNLFSYAISIRISTYLSLCTVFSMLWLIINVRLKNLLENKYFTYAWLAFTLGIFIVVLKTIGIMENNFIARYAYQAGSTIQLILLAASMADKINKSNEILLNLNRNLESKVLKRTDSLRLANYNLTNLVGKIKLLLDSSGQGFLVFKEDLIISNDYSKYCKELFKSDIGGKHIGFLLFQFQEKDRETFIKTLQRVFTTKDEQRRKLYFNLLPEELKINDRIVSLEFKIVEDDEVQVLIIITDQTENKLLKTQIEREQNYLKMTVRVLVDFEEFRRNLEHFDNFCNQEIYEIYKNHQSLSEIFRQIHTFKGTFGQFYMNDTVQKLHFVEGFIERVNHETFTIDDLQNLVLKFKLSEVYENDIFVINKIVGYDCRSSQEFIKVNKKELISVEQSLKSCTSMAEIMFLLERVRRLRFKSIKQLLEFYPEYIKSVATRNGKSINEIKIVGDEIYIDYDLYSNFIKALVHVFKNTIAHGIETPEERLEVNKNENGNIICSLMQLEGRFIVQISDDGRGIDLNKIKMQIIKNGIMKENTLNMLEEHEIIEHIFDDRFSTHNGKNSLTGRGVGLSAVKSEVTKLGGIIEVHSKINQGTTFTFNLPHIDYMHFVNKNLEYIGERIGKTIEETLIEQYNFTLGDNRKDYDIYGFVTAIKIVGDFEFFIGINCCRSFIDTLADWLLIDFEKNEIDEIVIYNEILHEFLNNSIGNSLQDINENGISIRMDGQKEKSNVISLLETLNGTIWEQEFTFETGRCRLSIFNM